MKSRWIAAAAAAAAVALLAVPLFLSGGAADGTDPGMDEPALLAGHTTPGCTATERAKLDFVVDDMHGTKVKLADYSGKVILVNYWATWCGPCKKEIPEFNELYAEYKDRGLVILGISADDDPETLRAFASEMSMEYPVLVGKDRDDVLDAFGPLVGYPTTFIVGRDGSVCETHLGPGTREDFEKTIKALL
jgi:peroxiredoxin